MARISRKELKKNEFAQEVSKTYEFAQAHRDLLIYGGLALAVLVVLGFGGYLLVGKRKANANESLARALRTYHAPVVAEVKPDDPEKRFTSDKAKYTQALTEFLAVAQKYSWVEPGRIARYYAGLTQADLTNYAEAEKELRAASSTSLGTSVGIGNADIGALARLALANVQARAGKNTEAEKSYRYLVEHPSSTVPRVEAQLALADYLRAFKPAEAQLLYSQIEKERPGTMAADLARQGLALVKPPASSLPAGLPAPSRAVAPPTAQ